MKSKKKMFQVGCAIIVKEKKILIAQRLPGTYLAGYWEFPGGKCEQNETLEDCLRREVMEELGVQVEPREKVASMMHDYPERTLELFFVICDWVAGSPQRKECFDFKWVRPRELHNFLFPKADKEIIQRLIQKERYYLRTGYIF